MKLIHLSDLHLGKRLNSVSFLEDQEYILRQILQIVEGERPQGVILAGDIYDKAIPSGEAVQLLDYFLSALAEREVPVFIISGNHDSPERLSFGNRLMQSSGIFLSPLCDGKIQPVTMQDEFGSVHIWLLPFLKPVHVRRYFPEEEIDSYTDALRVVTEHLHMDPAERNVLVTHQFLTGASTSESEEALSVGGSDNVDADLFADFDYVALGHIHRPQNMGSNRIRYCGTPLKYSFSEEDHMKTVTVVNLGQKGDLQLQTIPLKPLRDLYSVCGSFQELLDPEKRTEDYIHAILTDEEDVPEAMGRLRAVYPNILALSYDNSRTRSTRELGTLEDAREKSPLEVFEELYDKQNNRSMSQEQREFCEALIAEIWEGKV